MYLNSKIVFIILLHQCLLINCNDTHNDTTPKYYIRGNLNEQIKQDTKIEEGSGFLIYRRNVHDVVEYLLLQNSHDDSHYSPPKGHVKGSDGYMETAIRVTEEQTGIKEDDLEVDYTYQKLILYTPKSKGLEQEDVYWLARLKNPNQSIKLSLEHKAYVWLPIEEALTKVELPEMQKLLQKCDKHLK